MVKIFSTVIALSLFSLTGCMYSSNSHAPIMAPMAPIMMPAPPSSFPDTVTGINESDLMSRQFTFDEADLIPVPNSTRPSAVILFRNGVNAKKMNKALCEGFVQLPTPDVIEQTEDVPMEDQVVTKVPVKEELPQDSTDCDEILRVYDYNLAKKELGKLHPSLAYSNGPFVAVYNPNSNQINQLIDLRGTSENDLKKFGENWSSIFTEAAKKHKKIEKQDEPFTVWEFVREIFQATVCATDPNLIYIFNEPAGKIADIVCKGTKA